MANDLHTVWLSMYDTAMFYWLYVARPYSTVACLQDNVSLLAENTSKMTRMEIGLLFASDFAHLRFHSEILPVYHKIMLYCTCIEICWHAFRIVLKYIDR